MTAMPKNKFTTEFEINASNKMLFPYLTSPGGLSDWFADDVSLDGDKNYIFLWDGKTHKAKKITQKPNQYVKYEFFGKATDDKKELPYIEFKLDVNDMTQTSFLRIIDYTDFEDPKDMQELWNNLITKLKETVGA